MAAVTILPQLHLLCRTEDPWQRCFHAGLFALGLCVAESLWRCPLTKSRVRVEVCNALLRRHQ